ncbi:MAG: excinuclease ABC subunit UvrB, partial [Bifidobacteriaceae bacterium]|nr:excinuclease ABC subunit UvrB [Bifidobacteriaceae bacterium]
MENSVLDDSTPFEVISEFKPAGDQPTAISELVNRLNNNEQDVVVLGATGTGKSATIAWLLEKIQRPALIIEPNKTLAAQMCSEFQNLLPKNKVGYFVSYYDYYQPEAYLPAKDVYIGKDSMINDEIDRLRHDAIVSLLSRRDTVIVSSVSCIYGLGEPKDYLQHMLTLKVGQNISLDDLLFKFVDMHYDRSEFEFKRGFFRVRGDVIDLIPANDINGIRIEFFGDEIESLQFIHPVTANKIDDVDMVHIFPANLYSAGGDKMNSIIKEIRAEKDERKEFFDNQNRLVEAHRINQMTSYDLEMLEQTGSCKSIENYSRYFDGRKTGEPPYTLIDFFPKDFVTIIDESHIAVSQINAMYEGDRSRKHSLVDYGFRLPSALDNRPLKFDEFLDKVGQKIYLSATPGPYETNLSDGTVSLIIRPTGLVDPSVEISPIDGQIDDLVKRINKTVAKNERVLVTVITKKMAEQLTDYFSENNINARYLHSDVDTMERVKLLRELREGKFDVLVGINLLREGLDLPEVSLVAILDADKEGFLRSYRSLIQTIGRAARNVNGEVVLYADKITDSMKQAIDETTRRRNIQIKYNEING